MNKRKKIALTIGLVLTAIILIAQFYLNTIIEKMVWQELNSIIEEQKDDYDIEVGDIQVRFLLKRVVLHDVKVRSKDSTLLERQQHFDIDVKKLVIKIRKYREVYSEGNLDLKHIELQKPTFTLIKKKEKGLNEKDDEKETFESQRLKHINIGSFGINKGKFQLYNLENGVKKLSSSGDKVDFILKNIEINPDAAQIADRLFFENLKINLGNVEIHDLKNQKLVFSDLSYSNKEKGAFIDKLSFKNDVEFDQFLGNEEAGSTWTNIECSAIHFIIDFDKLGEKEIDIQSLKLGKLDLQVYSIAKDRDTSKFEFVNPLLKIGIPLAIDSIIIDDGSGWIKSQKNDYVAEYPFSNLQFEALSLSNDSIYNSINPEIDIKVQSNLWDVTSVNSLLKWDQKKNRIIGTVHLDQFPESQIQEQFRKNNLGDLYSCNLDEIDIEFIVDSTQIQGETKLKIENFNGQFDHLGQNVNLEYLNLKVNRFTLIASFLKEGNKQLNIVVDTLAFNSPDCKMVEKNELGPATNVEKTKDIENSPSISIRYFSINKASISYFIPKQEEALFKLNEANLIDRNIRLDLSKKGLNSILNTGAFKLDLKDLTFFKKALTQHFQINEVQVVKSKNEINIKGLRYKNKTSKNDFHLSEKEGNTWMSAYIEELDIKTDLQKILDKNITIDKINVIKPILTYIKAIDRLESVADNKAKKREELNLPIYINEIEVFDADVDFRVKTNEQKEFEFFDLSHANGFIKNIDLNTKTKKLRSSIYGKLKAQYYQNGIVNIDLQHSQRTRKAKTSIKAKIEDLSLKVLRNKMKVFKDLSYNDGSIAVLNFDLEIADKKLAGNVNIEDLTIEKVRLNNDKNGDWLTVNLESAKMEFQKDNEKAPSSKSITLINPQIDIHHPKTETTESDSKRKQLIVLKDTFKQIARADNLKIKGGRIRQFDGDDKLVPLTSVNNINVNSKNIILYDSTNTTLPVYIGSLDLELKNIIVHSLPHHDLTVSSLTLDLKNKMAHVKNLEFKNKESPNEFYKNRKYRKAWMDLVVPEMDIDVDLHKFFSVHPKIRKVNANEVKFITYVNLALPVSPDEKPLPNRMLNNAKFPITVDSILIHDGQLDVQFHDIEKYGLLQYNNIEGKVSNLSTDKDEMKNNDIMKWVMDATMWETGDTHVEVDYKLTSKRDEFTMKGTLLDMNLVDTDTLTKNLYGIKVNDGHLFRTEFEITGNNDEASGTISFEYDDLRLSLDKKKKNIKSADEIKKTKKKDKLNESFVKSVVVNGLLRTKNTPEKGKYIPSGNAYFKREKNKPIFHLMWYTLSSGILEIAESQVVKDIRNLKEGFNFKKNKKEE